MKKIQKNTFSAIKITAVSALTLFCLINTAQVKSAVYDSVMRCFNVVIPSLYAVMILSGFLIKSGLIRKLPHFITLPGKFLFGMNGCLFPIFILSQFAGYPVGVKMLCAEYENGSVSRRSAELLSGICYGAGPAFIFGCIASQMYGCTAAGKLILISNLSANIILAFIISMKIRKDNTYSEPETVRLNLSSDILTQSILSGGRSMADICIMITAFSVAASFLSSSGILELTAHFLSELSGINQETASGLIMAFLDVTSVHELPRNDFGILPIICGLSSFGGICVILQITSLVDGKLRLKPMILTRAAASVLSGIICRILMPFILADTAVSTSKINVSVHSSDSPVPSFLLIIMTIILFSEYEKIKNRNIC